jgi:hypothetical protein
MAGGADYVLASYTADANDKTTFIVQPPVPADKKGTKVRARVLRAPEAMAGDGELGIDCCYGPAIVEWMLYRAYGVDEESQSSAGRSQQHLATFFSILQLDASQQAALMVNKLGAGNVQVPAASSASN